MSLPERAYDLVGDILATGVERASAGEPLEAALEAAATGAGRAVGATAGASGVAAFVRALGEHGFEARIRGDVVLLANCAFDALARRHRSLVCGLNRAFVQGVADAVGCGLTADLSPAPGRCCVTARVEPVSPAP